MRVGWSFCIVTSPGNDSLLKGSIDSIISEFKGRNDYEIIIVGVSKLRDSYASESVRFFEVNEDFFKFDLSIPNIKKSIKQRNLKRLLFKYGPISFKKNYAAKRAKFENLCVLHDYVALESGWAKGFEVFGNTWSVCMNKIHNKDGSRHRDWCALDFPNIGAGLLPYNQSVPYMYFSGTYFCVKKQFFIDNPLDETLFWGESEDVEWSIRIRQKIEFRMNENSTVKYLKLKPLNEAPYCDGWREGTQKLTKKLGSKANK